MISREYYYFSQLESSPYELSKLDALHYGATGSLKMYSFFHEAVLLKCRFTGETQLFDSFFLRLPFDLLAAFEKETVSESVHESVSNLGLTSAFVDERLDGIVPFRSIFEKEPSRPFFVHVINDVWFYPGSLYRESIPIPKIGVNDLICWTDDLEELVKTEEITRRENVQNNSVTGQKAEFQSDSLNALNVDLQRTQRALASLAIGFSQKNSSLRYGNKPNVKQLADLAIEHLRDSNGHIPFGFSERTIREAIKDALNAFPELLNDSKAGN